MGPNLYRAGELVAGLTQALAEAARGLPPVRIMHVCGTHEHELGRYALRQLLPANLKLIAGPGCPVCITPAAAIATVIRLARLDPAPIVCAYGDIVRVPIASGSLWEAKAEGADVRMVYGPRDAVRLAAENPDREVVFFSIGFETTAAPVAALMRSELPRNFFIYCCHRWVPAAVAALAADRESEVAGYLLPGHAAAISGSAAYDFLPAKYGKAAAVAGFEPVDIMAALVSLARQLRQGRAAVANCYPRAVRPEGNRRALELLDLVFARTDAAWRGIGTLPATGLEPRPEYERLDALLHFGVEPAAAEDVMPGCSCPLVMVGRREPEECGLFGRACTPESPRGPCMVGGEGSCRARYLYPEREDG